MAQMMMDFDRWDQLLRQYVDGEGRVDYPRWQREAMQPLSAWLAQMSELNLAEHPTTDEQLALWLNLYNALTIEQVLRRYPIDSIRPKILGVPNWIAFLSFFLRPVYPLGGRRYSLNAIEHGVLRRQFNDPRIHFALVCASIGCPLLRNEAYRPERVQQQLENDAQRFINHPDKVHQQDGVLYCSQIFKWYRSDFLQAAPSVPDYIQTYWQSESKLDSHTPIVYLPYSWQLNQQG